MFCREEIINTFDPGNNSECECENVLSGNHADTDIMSVFRQHYSTAADGFLFFFFFYKPFSPHSTNKQYFIILSTVLFQPLHSPH